MQEICLEESLSCRYLMLKSTLQKPRDDREISLSQPQKMLYWVLIRHIPKYY